MKYLILILLLLASCGENSTNVNVNTSAYVALTSGTWSGCKAIASGSFRASIMMSDNSITSTIDTFSASTTCAGTSSFTSVKSGTFNVSSDTEQILGYSSSSVIANHLNITTTAFTMRPNNTAASLGWNGASVCGANDWVTNVAKNTLDLSNCDPAMSTNHPDESTGGVITNLIYIDTKVVPNKLYIDANISSNGAVTSRPTSLQSTGLYVIELSIE